jgi:hypothetical protein
MALRNTLTDIISFVHPIGNWNRLDCFLAALVTLGQRPVQATRDNSPTGTEASMLVSLVTPVAAVALTRKAPETAAINTRNIAGRHRRFYTGSYCSSHKESSDLALGGTSRLGAAHVQGTRDCSN